MAICILQRALQQELRDEVKLVKLCSLEYSSTPPVSQSKKEHLKINQKPETRQI